MWFYNVQQGFEIVPRSLRDQWDIEASFCVSFFPQNTHFSCWHRNGLKQCIHVKNWFQVFICLMKWNEMESYCMACQPCSYWVVSVWIGGEKGPEKVPCQRGSFSSTQSEVHWAQPPMYLPQSCKQGCIRSHCHECPPLFAFLTFRAFPC